ncbi:MAG: DHH family phosphoesterase [Mariprofundaceae bacterium]|nr:DHH family phosphoesterase [Mariprofundaceae bacterium]
MRYYDVFNGDADGICALHQLRLQRPQHSTLVTGVKRDIALLKKLKVEAGDHITVLDISLDKNRKALQQMLDEKAHVQYFDHHFSGDIPVSEYLFACIETSAEVCTSLLVNQHLQGAQCLWGAVGAFGDNLHHQARLAVKSQHLDEHQWASLERLGTLINYNAYGITTDDLWLSPDRLYRAVALFTDPFAFIAESPAYRLLDEGYASDIAQSDDLQTIVEQSSVAAFLLPNEPWARRISGVLGNQLARQHPTRAHALITQMTDACYRISVRAPLNDKKNADTLCMQFPTGGGRKAAAGINSLPAHALEDFIAAFRSCYG